MVWTTIPDGDIDPESAIDTPLMTSLRDNPIAIAGGLTGAPKVVNAALAGYPWGASDFAANSITAAELAAGAVHQSELSVLSAVFSASNNNRILFDSAAGSYGFFLEYLVAGAIGSPITAGEVLDDGWVGWSTVRRDILQSIGQENAASELTYTGSDIDGTYRTLFYVHGFREGGNSGTTTVRQTYVSSSPPFDPFGDGDVPLFVYLAIDKTSGEVIGSYISPTPPWAYNGPTNIKPNRYSRDGKAYKKVFVPDFIATDDEADMKRKLIAYRRKPLFERINDIGQRVEIEVDQLWKNADMDLIPNPMPTLPQNSQLLMLDPSNDMLIKLADLLRDGENVASLFHERHIVVDNVPIARKAPPGVMAVSARWR